jgi:hypothetical protein
MATTTSTTPQSKHVTTWEAFERLPDGDGLHREILEGEVQVLPPVKSGHSKIASKLFQMLFPLQQRGLGDVYLEAGYKLSEAPPTCDSARRVLSKDAARARNGSGRILPRCS